MASEIKANKISPATGTAFTLGDSGDTFTVPSGATIVNSGTATGFGKVLQLVKMTDNTSQDTTSTSYQDSTLTAAITPASSSNIIIAICAWHARSARASATDVGAQYRIYNSTDTTSIFEGRMAISGSSTNWDLQYGMTYIGYDTGRSVATTYLLQYKGLYGSSAYVNYTNGGPGYLMLMEIEA